MEYENVLEEKCDSEIKEYGNEIQDEQKRKNKMKGKAEVPRRSSGTIRNNCRNGEN